MLEIRFHGRGGQGAVIASKILAVALFSEGQYVQTFPAFGVERRGAPVMAFVRVDEEYIDLRCEVYNPEHVVVLDPSLLEAVDVTSGLKEGGTILINSDKPPEHFKQYGKFRVATIDASAIAVEHELGTRQHPIVNTAILGAFAKQTGLVKLDSVIEAIAGEVPFKRENNAQAARDAFDRLALDNQGGQP
ncbi:MAG TPA: 2-oxoacid:acceptor oxidoreductase family protein [Acidobacteriota bacterium]|nr:2-oxoacid:acceptor oxidoreductase family protein [Acidobacteriota bacterium]